MQYQTVPCPWEDPQPPEEDDLYRDPGLCLDRDRFWDLLEESNGNAECTGAVVGVEGLTSTLPAVLVNWHSIPVRIPGRKLFAKDWPEGQPTPGWAQERMGRMLGAEVDFIPYKVQRQRELALGDRRAALRQKQQLYYDTGAVRPGTYTHARVLGVARDRIWTELYGVETETLAEDLLQEWVPDLRQRFRPGDLMDCQVVETKQGPDGWSLTVTRKVEGASPDAHALRHLTVGGKYSGTVCQVLPCALRIRLHAGCNLVAEPLPAGPAPEPEDYAVVLLTDIDHEQQMAYGTVLDILPQPELAV